MIDHSPYSAESDLKKILDLTVRFSEAIVLIIGAYQFYFWCQRRSWRRPLILSSRIDRLIPFKPGWVWIYSGLYYPVIVWLTIAAHSMREFSYITFSYLLLLALQMLFFLLLPIETPPEWRLDRAPENLSESFLLLVQRLDAPSNCFPSMHVSVATLTAFHLANLMPSLRVVAHVFPVLIAISALYTKQHYILDLPAGFLCGWAIFLLYGRLPT